MIHKFKYFEILCCPFCWHESLNVDDDVILCPRCFSTYSIVNEIAIMIPTNRSGNEWVKNASYIAEERDRKNSIRINNNDGWWLPSKDKFYRLKQEHNLRCGRWKVIEDIGKNFSNVVLIDVGGGEGFFQKDLQDKFDNRGIVSIGYDISHILQSDGKTRYNAQNLYFVTGDCNRIAIKSGTSDIVTATEVIEHIRDLNIFFFNVNRILKRNGRLYITTPKYFGFSYWFSAKGIKYLRNLYHFIKGKSLISVEKNDGYILDEGAIFERILKYKDIEKFLIRNKFKILNVEFTQFFGEATFVLFKYLKLPLRLVELVVKSVEFFERVFNWLQIAHLIGFTQVIIAEKIDDL